ncbi:fimbrillin family protein [Dysgonomonas sp. Marseille-P4677]|nr:fimbrillin family protein [Dysgonomonas sp. Marseille-P4677]
MTAFADNTGAGYDKANTSAINLRFKHQLAKIVINVANGAGIPNLTGLTVSIEGMNTNADFDLKGTAGITNISEIVAITPFDAGSNNYEAILLPVTLNNTHVVRFTVGGNTYIWTISNNNNNITAFESSKKYTFNVTINKEEVQVTGAIDVWENGGSGTGIGN